uniref:Uncharacterized protein n=1 Tax=Nothobranchius furzeri TaxID=105023 RepID=A0A8C6Q6J6_NOTFU
MTAKHNLPSYKEIHPHERKGENKFTCLLILSISPATFALELPGHFLNITFSNNMQEINVCHISCFCNTNSGCLLYAKCNLLIPARLCKLSKLFW